MPFKGPLELIKMNYSSPQIWNTTESVVVGTLYVVWNAKTDLMWTHMQMKPVITKMSVQSNESATALKFYKYNWNTLMGTFF